jgi:hypothetical protein
MAVLSTAKDIERTELETHVVLCEQRRAAMLLRLEKLESKLSQADERNERIRNMLLGGFISLAAGIAGTVFAVLFKHGVVS